ncbi:MAG: multiheme c-type cytochrome [Acidobacteriota bacterium]
MHRGAMPLLIAIACLGAYPALAAPGMRAEAGAPAAPASEASSSSAARAAYTPARECGECHTSIHEAWADSPHARSATDPGFLSALREAVAAGADRRDCLWCHAPTILVTEDVALEGTIAREGITCDFCHTVADVDMERPDRFTLDPGEVKRGPFRYSEPVGHETAYSALHRASPLLCASCHEFTNANGVAVLSTYTEWREGPYPERGVPCQDCHMALVPGTKVRAGLARKGSPRLVNLHRLVGGSARGQLERGLDLAIESLERAGGRGRITVTVKNVAAGHAVPGGLATKSLVLTVGVDAGNAELLHRQRRVYLRELKDGEGRILETVPDLFLKAASVGRDSRIRPGESRTERFILPLPRGARAVVARLEYRNGTESRSSPRVTLITETRRDLRSR